VRIEQLTDQVGDAVLDGLAEVLVDCVAGGASVGFLAGFDHDQARAFWRTALATPDALTWLAREDGGRIVGAVRLVLAGYPNAAHRAEVSKLLVHRSARGLGVATALLAEVDAAARRLGRTVLHLDTETDSPAQRLYQRLGWEPFGVMRDHAALPDGTLAPTTFMVKYV
jgi:ribosomal protein S18 acetylase RimI-like enzyme